ncbi:MAG: sialidase family protein [Solirubrobacteraceae bacterium]
MGRLRNFRHASRTAKFLTLALVVAGISAAVAYAQIGGSNPPSGKVGPASGSSTKFTFDPIVGVASGGTEEEECAPTICSRYHLKIKLPAADAKFYRDHQARLSFHCAWDQPLPTDADCFAISPSGGSTGPGKPDTGDAGKNYEDLVVNNPVSGTWTLEAQSGATVPQPTTVKGIARLTITSLPSVPRLHIRRSDARFTNFDFSPSYQTRDALHRPDAGEPSLGINWQTGNVMYMAGDQVTRITYVKGHPRKPPTTTDVTPSNSKVNEDAILFTDHGVKPNRTWALGLLLAGSYTDYTDNDGKAWTPGLAFAPPAFPDHETLGSGPYSKAVPVPSHSYPHAVYYCAQTIVQDAYCARSDDGGVSYNSPATPLWNGTCTPIHGHLRVGPTGIAYVPNASCTDPKGKPRSGVAVSVDDGQSFKVSTIPDSSGGTSDPSVMEGPDGKVYFGYQADSGHPMIAVATHDAKGNLHWRKSIDVGRFQDPGQTEDGLPHGVQNTEFSEVITGSPGRAAFAFLGTGTQGAYQDGAFPGTWYLFVSYTTNGGRTWRTVNATPHDPVQRGCVWNGGLVNACRNMLDFNDIGIDPQGHVYVAYTDGCTTSKAYSCDKTPGIHGWNNLTSGDQSGCPVSEAGQVLSSRSCTFARLSAIVRQLCGTSLIAGHDTKCGPAPKTRHRHRKHHHKPPRSRGRHSHHRHRHRHPHSRRPRHARGFTG